MDKNGLLKNNIKKEDFNKIVNKLFDSRIDLYKTDSKFQYGDYEYMFDSNKISWKSSKCEIDTKIVSYLYGYSIGNKGLFMDVLIGTLKDDKLYDYKDELIGLYNGNKNKLLDLLNKASYYRYYYQRKIMNIGLVV